MKTKWVIIMISICTAITIFLINRITPKLIDLTLAVTLVVIEVPIGILFHHFTKEKKTGILEKHSEKIGNAINIMSEGHYGEHLDKTEFLIPYPYSEYKQSQRKNDFPTLPEKIELFNKRDWSDKEDERHEFVPITESPEGNFEQAIDHLKSYKHIIKMQEKAKTASEELGKFLHEKQKEVYEINQKSWKLDNPESHPLYPQYKKLIDDYGDSRDELQKLLKILAQQLEDGKMIKGKCRLGY